jgi:hypothetical protein
MGIPGEQSVGEGHLHPVDEDRAAPHDVQGASRGEPNTKSARVLLQQCAVPAGIRVAQRVAVNVGVTIERLRVPRLGHDGIRLQEAAQRGIIEARPVIIQAQALLPPLAGETPELISKFSRR